MTTYIDKTECPKGHKVSIRRRIESAGAKVTTRCPVCDAQFKTEAGATTEQVTMRERDIEKQLVKRVKELGGEVRKVQWAGRNSAPDRIVMLPLDRAVFRLADAVGGPDNLARALLLELLGLVTVWPELKAPGRAATFPKNAHEKAQHREHERMRKMGQRVEVVDSYERIEEILK